MSANQYCNPDDEWIIVKHRITRKELKMLEEMARFRESDKSYIMRTAIVTEYFVFQNHNLEGRKLLVENLDEGSLRIINFYRGGPDINDLPKLE